MSTAPWANQDHHRLGAVARHMLQQGVCGCYLTRLQTKVLLQALDAGERTWEALLNGVLAPKLVTQESAPQTQKAAPNVLEELDPAILALRVRYMLWDRSIPILCGSAGDVPFYEDQSGKTARQQTEDDYDEDDEVEKEQQEPKIEITLDETEQEQSAIVEATVLQNATRTVLTLENDHNNLAVLLKAYKASTIEKPATREPVQPTIAKNASLKHLMAFIDENRPELNISDLELKRLVRDVRRNPSKWASRTNIGQEELYDACERVLIKLRGITEHVTPFLTKVNKRDAPDYYDVIKRPMDLSTMMKKLRNLQYASKAEFVEDLMLIWQNCLTYNSNPKHFIRPHAFAMKRESEALIPTIPDIVVRSSEHDGFDEARKRRKVILDDDGDTPASADSRIQTPMPISPLPLRSKEYAMEPDGSVVLHEVKQEEKHLHRGVPERQPEKSVVTPEGAKGPNGSNGQVNGQMSVSDAHNTPDRQSEPQTERQNEKQKSEPLTERPTTDAPQIEKQTTEPPETTEPPQTKRQTMEPPERQTTEPPERQTTEPPEATTEPVVADRESALWQELLADIRSNYIVQRHLLFRHRCLQMDTPIIQRRAGLMAHVYNVEKLVMSTRAKSSRPPSVSETPLLEYDVANGVVSAPLVGPETIIPSVGSLPPTRMLASGFINDRVNQNLNEIQNVRRLCAKVNLIREMQQNPHSNAPLDLPVPGEVKDPEPDISSTLPNAEHMFGPACYKGLRRGVSKVAMSAGFDSTNMSAIDVLTSVAGEYLSKFARILAETYSDPLEPASCIQLLTKSLSEMGVSSHEQLVQHLSDDIFTFGSKLKEVRRSVTSMLNELLQPVIENYKDEQFNDNSEQFVLGQFSSELGDDYFGLKELGISKELGLDSVTVPFHLLRQKLKSSETATPFVTKAPERSFVAPRYPPLSKDQVPRLIGLLIPTFTKMFQETEQLVEDDALPNKLKFQRPRIPTTGKITAVKAKPRALAFIRQAPKPEVPKEIPEVKEVAKEPEFSIDEFTNLGKGYVG